jgi:uncharacterized protein YbaR (Trm112 family)
MVVKALHDEAAREFMRDLVCPECKKRASYNGSGQAGIHRVVCYYCGTCDVIYQLITEKHGVPMFEASEKDGKCVLTADDAQDKCNVCACGLYPTPDQMGE